MKLVLTRKQCSAIYDKLCEMEVPKEHLHLFDVSPPASVVEVPEEYKEVTLAAILNLAIYMADKMDSSIDEINLKLDNKSSYHPCTSILIDGLKQLPGGQLYLQEWDRARNIYDNK